MGKTQSKAVDNTGTVQNNIELEIHQAEIVNTELFIILYIMLVIQVANLACKIYKAWHHNLKRRYITRAQSIDLV